LEIAPAGDVAHAFCDDLKTHAYPAAYALLSSNLHGRITQPQFVQAAQQGDTADGTVQSCTVQEGPNPQDFINGSVSVRLQITRNLSCLVDVGMEEHGRHLLLFGNWTISQYGASGNNGLTKPGCFKWQLENNSVLETG
jgi:hypothetical protein